MTLRETVRLLPGRAGLVGRTGARLLAGLPLLLSLLLSPGPAFAQEGSDSPTAMLSFEAKRLLLMDGRGKALGPAKLGFEPADFTMFKEQRFHAVRAGEIHYRLDADEFLELTRDRALQQRWEQTHARLKRRKRGSVVLLVIGAGLTATGLVGGSLAFATNDSNAPVVLPLVFASSAALLVSGTAVNSVTRRRQKRLDDHNLEDLMDRDEAWRASSNYNDALWRSLALKPAPAAPATSTEAPASP